MAIKTNFKQSHFVLYELVLPYHTICVPSNGLTEQWHTPLTCEGPSDAEYSLWFTSNSAPIMAPPSTSINIKSRLNSSVWRVVANATETTPRLKPGEGMASRGTISISLNDFEGDPGPVNFSDTGTFFGKLNARNVLDGKKIISHKYSITPDQEAPELVGSSIHYIEEATLTGGKFTIKAKDALKDLEAFSQKFPVPTEAALTADIDDSVIIIPVNDGALFAAEGVIIIDKELMRIQSINVNDLTVYARGSDYLPVYKTEAKSHTTDSTVQICYVMNDSFLSNVLQDVFNTVGLSAYVDFTQWDDEISDWNENAFLNGVFHEPTNADDIINHLLTDYMIDLWLDQSTQKAKVSATTAWKQSIRTIVEGDDLTDLKTSTKANTRFSRAYIYNDKDFQAENDDTTNYSRLTLHKDLATETDDLYGSIKVKEFRPSPFITPDSAFILVSRYVQRFARTPGQLNFKMEERKLASSGLGDIVDIVTRDSQTPSGEFLQSKVRAQLIEIRPNLNDVGRSYNVTALSYVPLIATGGDLVIFFSGADADINIYVRAGAPNTAWIDCHAAAYIDSVTFTMAGDVTDSYKAGKNVRVENSSGGYVHSTVLSSSFSVGYTTIIVNDTVIPVDTVSACRAMQITCVFDDSTIGSSVGNPSIRAGGSLDPYITIKLIFTNNSKVSAIGGRGGDAYVENRENNGTSATTTSGGNGADVYQSDGIATEIYINYGTVDTYATDCDFFAAGGGGSAVSGVTIGQATTGGVTFDDAWAGSAVSGSGGSGIPSGSAGTASRSSQSIDESTAIVSGFNGSFANGGATALTIANDISQGFGTEVNATSTNGAGGDSADGQSGSFIPELVSGTSSYHIESVGSAGLAGGAIKGANVIVYNLTASANRFKQGNSDAFTLITV